MTEKRKDMFERTVENLKKLDKESLAIVKASIEILVARQQMDQHSARSKRRQIVAFLLRSKEKSSKWKPPLKK